MLRNNSYAVELEDRVIIDRNDQIVNELKSDKKNANYSNESLKAGQESAPSISDIYLPTDQAIETVKKIESETETIEKLETEMQSVETTESLNEIDPEKLESIEVLDEKKVAEKSTLPSDDVTKDSEEKVLDETKIATLPESDDITDTSKKATEIPEYTFDKFNEYGKTLKRKKLDKYVKKIDPSKEVNDKTNITAKTLVREEEKSKITALGDVVVTNELKGITVYADKITYDQIHDIVTAEGNVVIVTRDKDIIFAEKAQLDEVLENAALEDVRTIMSDNSRIASEVAIRRGGKKTNYKQAAYTPCAEDCFLNVPSWQLKSVNVIHDETKKNLNYQDAIAEVFGFPVFYTPYFSHPDPSVDRRRGFLAPSWEDFNDIGRTIHIPYHIPFTPWRDMTITPVTVGKEQDYMLVDYRQKTKHGRMDFTGSFTGIEIESTPLADGRGESGKTRNHLFGKGVFEQKLEEYSSKKYGFTTENTNDDFYMRKYYINNNTKLTNSFYYIDESEKTVKSFNLISYETLTASSNDRWEYILPQLSYSRSFDFLDKPEINDDGEEVEDIYDNFTYSSSFLNQRKNDRSKNTYLVNDLTWTLPYTSKLGEVITFTSSGKLVNHYIDQNSGQNNVEENLFFPQFATTWKLPLQKRNEGFFQTLEPTIQGIISPYANNPEGTSSATTINASNLFSLNRYQGFDKWEEGPRLNIGMLWGINSYKSNGPYLDFLIGQAFRLREDTNFSEATGLRERKSDFVGKVNYFLNDYNAGIWSIRIDETHPDLIKQSDFTFETGTSNIRLKGSHTYSADAHKTTGEQISVGTLIKFPNNFSFKGTARRNLMDEKWVGAEGGLYYEDPCLLINLRYQHDYTVDRSLTKSSGISFLLTFKPFGEAYREGDFEVWGPVFESEYDQ